MSAEIEETSNEYGPKSGEAGFSEATGSRLVSAERLLEILFEDESRPSMRWIRGQTKARTIPFYKIGHLVRFDPSEVRQALRTDPKPQRIGRWDTPTGGENAKSTCEGKTND